jgi:hypothetical protein
MVRLVPIAQTLQNLNRVSNRGLFDLDGLEATLERCVLFEVLTIFIDGGGTNGLQFTTSQHGLKNRCSVDGAFSGTSTNEGVELIDEQDDVAAGLDLLEHLLEAFFEVAAVARPGDKSAEVKCVEMFVTQCLGDIA